MSGLYNGGGWARGKGGLHVEGHIFYEPAQWEAVKAL
jgi:hypothetical protein